MPCSHRECHALFPDELFADLFATVGRRSVPPMIVAVVMVLQRLEGLLGPRGGRAVHASTRAGSTRRAACDFDYPGFAHTVLVDMRARLARSERPDRIFEVARSRRRRRPGWWAAGGCSTRRRCTTRWPRWTPSRWSARRSGAARGRGRARAARCGRCCAATTTTRRAGKPACDWDDAAAREALVDALARDGHALLARAGRASRCRRRSAQAAALLATRPRPGPRDGRRRGLPDRPAGGHGPGHLAPSTPTPATGTRPPPAASTATRATSRSTPTPRSSPRPRSRRATRATPRSRYRDLLADELDLPPATAARRDADPLDRLRRRRLRHGRAARDARGSAGAVSRLQGPAADRARRPLQQGRLRDRPRRRARSPARPGGRGAAPAASAHAARQLRRGLRRLPAGRPAAPPRRTGARSRSAPTRRSSPPPAPRPRPRLEGRLPGHPAEGRAQDRPPHAPPPRRPTRPRPGQARSPPTSRSSPPRSTSPGSRSSGSPGAAEPGRSGPA